MAQALGTCLASLRPCVPPPAPEKRMTCVIREMGHFCIFLVSVNLCTVRRKYFPNCNPGSKIYMNE
jgi:hypothetical protein